MCIRDRNVGGKVQTISNLAVASDVLPTAIPVLPLEGQLASAGEPSPDHAKIITESIEGAVEYCLEGEADGMITNPISKDILYQAGFKFPGHTEYLGELTASVEPPYARGPVMMLSGGGLRVGLATVHLALKDAATQLSADAILNLSLIHI